MSKRIRRRRSNPKAQPSVSSLETTTVQTLAAAVNSIHSYDMTDINDDINHDLDNDNAPREVHLNNSHISAKRITANQANAQKSTGPISPEGKAVSSLNALKHGLTGNTVLIATDDAGAYQQRLDAHVEHFKPVAFEERRLVQSIHDHAWRLDRILNLESTIYAKGRIELSPFYSELPEDQRASFIQLETSDRYAKDLRNLHTQEARLQGQRARDIKALALLQKERKAQEQANTAAEQSKPTPQPKATTQPVVGFVFTTPEIAPSTPAILSNYPLDQAA